MSEFLRRIPRRSLSSRRRRATNWIGTRQDREETSPEKLAEISRELKDEAKRLGLSLVGITSPRQSARFAKYEEWLQKGYHGELDYMAREDRVARRRDPSIILPGVQSVIMVGMLYWPGKTGFPALHDPELHPPLCESRVRRLKGSLRGGVDERDLRTRGVVSSYAWGGDYHGILVERLKKLGKHLNGVAGGVGRFYVDTGAILERDFAERAGLGFVGKNTLLIDARVGSGFFIGELFSTVKLDLDGDGEAGVRKGRAGCGKCRKCIVACPTGAIVEEYVVDARRCISYLTIELKGDIPMELRRGMGNRVYGCDICQQVCPWNRIEWEGKGNCDGGGYSVLFGRVGERVTSPKLQELVEMDEKEFREQFGGSAVERIGRERMARNAAVALGNVGGAEELKVLERVAEEDESEMVRGHASWGVQEIRERLGLGKGGIEGDG